MAVKASSAFMANPGVWDAAVLFRTLGTAEVVSFGLHEVLLPLAASSQGQELLDGLQRADAATTDEPAQLRMRFEGAGPATIVAGDGLLAGVVNYFIGNDPAKWLTGVPTYGSVVYKALYPGIDLAYVSGEGSLKGTYTVAPGADPTQIRWRYDGITDVTLRGGELQIGAEPLLVERQPVAWQTVSGRQVAVSVSYVLHDDGSVGFGLGKYDPTLPLVIDPTIAYSTYAGNVACQGTYHTALDADGNIYLAGAADTREPPVGGACADDAYYDIFVTKLDPSLSGVNQLIYTTYVGGNNLDLAVGVGVDDAGKVYVGGYTMSNDFATTPNALLTTFQDSPAAGADGVVVQLSAAGVVQYATYIGGSTFEEIFSASVSSDGLIAVTGFTEATDFPVTVNAYKSTPDSYDAFLSVLDPSKSGNASLVYSTYFGGTVTTSGTGGDEGYAIEFANGLIYLAGTTNSADLPTKNPVQASPAGTPGGYGDTYVAVFDYSRTGTDQLRFCTYLGGTGNQEVPWGVTADSTGNIYVVGYTDSADFPTAGVSTTFGGGDWDGFLAKINPTTPALVYSRYVGGNGRDGLRDVVVDGEGNAHVAGGSGSTNLSLVGAIDDTNGGGTLSKAAYLDNGDALVASFNSTGVMIFGTFLGGTGGDIATGIALDDSGLLHVAGSTESTDLVTVNPYQATNAGGADNFAAQIAGVAATPTATVTVTPTVTPTVVPTSTPSTRYQYVPIVRQH